MQNNGLLILGQTNYRNIRRRFGIKPEDRRRHTFLLGKTGAGKSTLLLNCIVQDIQAGRGVAVIDPHGDLVEHVLDHIPARRINETIYFNPADSEYPIAFNVLSNPDARQRHLVASGVVQVFKKIWTDSWGPRLEYVLRNAILALLEARGNTLLGVNRLLVDDHFRARIVSGLQDPMLRHFWTVEFEQYPKVFRTETISPILNKVGQFLTDPVVRNIVGQTTTKFDLSDVLDAGKVLLLNLAKGKIGEENSALLGSMMITQLYLAALRRAAVTEGLRSDYFVYIDETHSYATEDFPAILSEARKYRLVIAGMANQFLAQLPKQLAASILGNVGTFIAFNCGSEDAAILAREFYPTFHAVDLQSLPQYNVYLRLSIDGKTSEPFSAETLPPPDTLQPSNRGKIIAQSRMRYCQKRTQVERQTQRWMSA